MVKTATDLSLEVTGVDLLGLETTGDITPPLRHPTPTPQTRTSRPTTPIREGGAPTSGGSRVEFPMLVRALAPGNLSPWFDQLGDVGDYVAPQRTFTKESSIELPEEDFFRAVSCAHRGKNGRAVSMSFLRQISPMLRQISPERWRQISEGKESNLTIQQTSPGPMVGKMMSEPVRFSGALFVGPTVCEKLNAFESFEWTLFSFHAKWKCNTVFLNDVFWGNSGFDNFQIDVFF